MRTALARFVLVSIGLAGVSASQWQAFASTPELRTSSAAGQPKLVRVKAPQTASVSETGAAAEITFENIGVSGAETGAGDLEVTLRFDGPLDAAMAESAAAKLPRWIAFATPGYDSLLIRTRKKAAFGVTKTATGFVLRISWAADPASAGQENFQRLRLLTMTGETTRARALIDDLRKLPAEDDRLDRAEAELLVAERDRRAALRMYEKLSSANASDLGLRRSVLALRRDLSDYAEAEISHQSVEDGDTQTRIVLRGRADTGPASAVQASIENVQLNDDAVLKSDGEIVAFDGSRARLRAAYDVEAGGGVIWSAIVHAGAPGLGVGGEVAWRRGKYDIALRSAYNEPFFGFVESIFNDGVRDSIEASIGLRGARHWSAGASAGVNRYGLKGVDAAATSVAVDGFVRYETEIADRATLIFAYMLDAEYVGDVAIRTDAFGAAFAPLPLSDREVHSLGLGLYKEWDGGVSLDAMTGYADDRYAEGGLFARANVTYDLSDAWRMFANASYAEVNARGTGGGAVTTAGAGVTYRFGGPGVLFRRARGDSGS
jgi:hypothetical protein